MKEIIVTILLITTSILLLNPFDFWMPDMLVISMLLSTLVLFSILASFILREKVFDERDALHRTIAGRNAFLAGSTIIIVGIIVQGYKHAIDPWLIFALIIMTVTKIVSRMWSDKNL